MIYIVLRFYSPLWNDHAQGIRERWYEEIQILSMVTKV
jgi:hypothetical protein